MVLSIQPTRFRDQDEDIYQMMEDILVVCPRCSNCAVVKRKDPKTTDWFSPRRLTCRDCGLSKNWSERSITRRWRDSAKDDYFGLPLWLQAPCCGHVLWAYNARHLQFIRDYVRSGLRERHRSPKTGWSNRSLASRLPQWMVLAKNRDATLKALAKLDVKLRGTFVAPRKAPHSNQ